MNDLERLMQLAGRRPEPGAEVRARARSAARDAWTHAVAARRHRRRAFIIYPALAAAAAILVFALWPSRQTMPPVVGTMAGTSLTAGATVQTRANEFAVVSLEGGAHLRLNAGTTIQLTGPGQIEIGRGQVYVDAGEAGGPQLTIRTPAGVLQDIGTRFDVRLDDTRVRVRVRDGVVRLTHASGQVDVAAGQQLVAGQAIPVSVTSTLTYGPDWDWVMQAAPFRVDGARLDAFLRWVETDGGMTVVFADPALRDHKAATILHGSIAGLSLTDALSAILTVSGLRYHTEGDRIIIDEAGPRR